MLRGSALPNPAPPATAAGPDATSSYLPGQCNIGPAEIARRRQLGHAGAIVTLLGLLLVVLTTAPPWVRLLLFFPAAGAAAGYLQAAFHFCADYGWRGVFNFGRAGHNRTTAVDDARARRADRMKAVMIAGASAGIGAVVAGIALLIQGIG